MVVALALRLLTGLSGRDVLTQSILKFDLAASRGRDPRTFARSRRRVRRTDARGPVARASRADARRHVPESGNSLHRPLHANTEGRVESTARSALRGGRLGAADGPDHRAYVRRGLALRTSPEAGNSTPTSTRSTPEAGSRVTARSALTWGAVGAADGPDHRAYVRRGLALRDVPGGRDRLHRPL